MNGLISAIPTGIAAFAATNLDDLVILTLLFSQVNETLRRRHIVIGQYLGFTALLTASLTVFWGGLIFAPSFVGLLGLIPLSIGFNHLLNPDSDGSPEDVLASRPQSEPSLLTGVLSPQTYSVAAITLANGGDNIGIYMPLFANSGWEKLPIILGIFFVLLGVWCFVTYKLTRQPAIATVLTQYGHRVMPYVLIGLGILIILESKALTPQALFASSLCLIGLIKLNQPEVEEEKN